MKAAEEKRAEEEQEKKQQEANKTPEDNNDTKKSKGGKKKKKKNATAQTKDELWCMCFFILYFETNEYVWLISADVQLFIYYYDITSNINLPLINKCLRLHKFT